MLCKENILTLENEGENTMSNCILAIDPGREKCGIAVLTTNRQVNYRAVILTTQLTASVEVLLQEFAVNIVVVGNGTNSGKVHSLLQAIIPAHIAMLLVDEYRTTDEARSRYWQEQPPQGWRKWVPRGMLTPPVPVDDWVAVILAERYLLEKKEKREK